MNRSNWANKQVAVIMIIVIFCMPIVFNIIYSENSSSGRIYEYHSFVPQRRTQTNLTVDNVTNKDDDRNYYFNLIKRYQLLLHSISALDNHIESNKTLYSFTNLTQMECKYQSETNKYTSLPEVDANCYLNYKERCTLKQSNKLYAFPNYNIKSLQNDTNYQNQLKTIQNLTYLIVSYHGGCLIDTISYLNNILKIPSQNIGETCGGSYCKYLNEWTNIQNSFNKNLSNNFQRIINGPNMLNWCCWPLSYHYLGNITHINRIQNRLNKSINDMIDIKPTIDVIICVFPSVQCLFLWPFAKTFIIRFMHRFDHHVWVDRVVKWVDRVILKINQIMKCLIIRLYKKL